MSKLDKVVALAAGSAPEADQGVHESVKYLASALDAVLDEACHFFSQVEMDSLDPVVAQGVALAYAAHNVGRSLAEALGASNPDEGSHMYLSAEQVGPLLVLSGDDPNKPYGDVEYADPGYRKDKKRRYPIDTEKHVRAALSYFSKPKNQSYYSPSQVKSIMGRIRSAAKKFGIQLSD